MWMELRKEENGLSEKKKSPPFNSENRRGVFCIVSRKEQGFKGRSGLPLPARDRVGKQKKDFPQARRPGDQTTCDPLEKKHQKDGGGVGGIHGTPTPSERTEGLETVSAKTLVLP